MLSTFFIEYERISFADYVAETYMSERKGKTEWRDAGEAVLKR
jgi:hypothetical protein